MKSTTWAISIHCGLYGLCLRRLHQIGLGVQLHQVRHIGIVHAVASDEAELSGKDADVGFGRNAEKMLGIIILRVNPWPEEIVIKMLCFLISGKEHQPSAAFGDLEIVLLVLGAAFLRHIQRNYDIICHFHSPILSLFASLHPYALSDNTVSFTCGTSLSKSSFWASAVP